MLVLQVPRAVLRDPLVGKWVEHQVPSAVLVQVTSLARGGHVGA